MAGVVTRVARHDHLIYWLLRDALDLPTEIGPMPLLPSLTRSALDALPAADTGKRLYFNDAKTPGLQVAVTDRGQKSFYLYRRIKQRPTRVFLGKYPAMSPEQARKRATQLLGQLAMGLDIVSEARADDARRVTLAQAFTAFKQVRHALRPNTLKNYTHYMQTALASWQSRPLVSITKAMVSDRHRELTDSHGGSYADGAMRVLRTIFNFAQFHYEAPDGAPLLPDNPVRRLSQTRQWNRPKRRTTVLKVDQLKPWFDAVYSLKREHPLSTPHIVADYLLLLIFTGLRRSEAASLCWDHLDFGNRSFTVPQTKNGEPHTLPMSDFVYELLLARRAVSEGAAVFPGTGRTGQLAEPRPQMRHVIARSGVTFLLHDLRRTFVTVADSLDLSAYALKRLVNHKMSGDVTAGYVISDVERLREPMQRVAALLIRKAGLVATGAAPGQRPVTLRSNEAYPTDKRTGAHRSVTGGNA